MGRKKGSRNYPLAFKRQVVAEALAAPSIAAVSRKHGLNANMVHLWCRDERFRPGPDAAVLLPVEVVDAIDDCHRTTPMIARIEITTRSGHRLVVSDSEDPSAIASLVRALEAV
jgi:transposase-like protein